MIDWMLLPRPWSAYEAIKSGNRAFKVSPSRLMNDQALPSPLLILSTCPPSFSRPLAGTSPLSEPALERRAEGRQPEDTFNEVSRTTTPPASYSAPPPPISPATRIHPL